MGSICNPLTTDDVASKYVGTFVRRVTDDRCTRQPTEPGKDFTGLGTNKLGPVNSSQA